MFSFHSFVADEDTSNAYREGSGERENHDRARTRCRSAFGDVRTSTMYILGTRRWMRVRSTFIDRVCPSFQLAGFRLFVDTPFFNFTDTRYAIRDTRSNQESFNSRPFVRSILRFFVRAWYFLFSSIVARRRFSRQFFRCENTSIARSKDAKYRNNAKLSGEDRWIHNRPALASRCETVFKFRTKSVSSDGKLRRIGVSVHPL